MEDVFKYKNLILRIGDDLYQLDTLDEVNLHIFGEDYFSLNEKDKFYKRYELILPYSFEHNREVIHTLLGVIKSEKSFVKLEEYDINSSLIINDEISFILSLCMIDQITILEKKDANIFAKNIDKTDMEGNYIVINNFTEEILEEYLV